MVTNGALIADRYRLQRLIATGGMGQVWEALDTRLDRRVAIKVLKSEFSADPTFRHRFRTEARTTAQLNHPGIAGIYDYGENQDPQFGETAYLVMELVQGEPLNTVLTRLGRLSVAQVLDMLEQTGRALQVAHGAGVVHRDVKPGNILVTPTGQVKITDFGIAKAVDASPVTKTGMVMGTAQYIAPEQAVGEEATSASDVYSLGVVGYEALTGSRPFTGDGAITVAMKHVQEPPPPLPSELPPNVRELIDITLAKSPAQRYGDGGEFAAAVAEVRAGRRPTPPHGMPTEPMTEGATRALAGSTTAFTAGGEPGATSRFASDYPRRGTHGASHHRRAAEPSGVSRPVLLILGIAAVLVGALAAWFLFGSGTNTHHAPASPTLVPHTTTQLPSPSPTTTETPNQYKTTTTAPPSPRQTTTTRPPTTTPSPTTTYPNDTETTTVPETAPTYQSPLIPNNPGFEVPSPGYQLPGQGFPYQGTPGSPLNPQGQQ